MKKMTLAAGFTTVFILTSSFTLLPDPWLEKNLNGITLYYTKTDNSNLPAYEEMISEGRRHTGKFFNEPFKDPFKVFIYPERLQMDKAWQRDWQMPDFKSECWMVASGVATKRDLLSPATWKKEACEHDSSDRTESQRLITHELVHVYHGQLNASPDFSAVEGIDWLIEGLATYASGQCDSTRLADVKKAVMQGEAPESLDFFWQRNLRYGFSGSLLQWIDHRYGRPKLIELLPLAKKEEVLKQLNISENELITDWKNYILQL